MDSTTHIVPLMVGDPVRAKKISDILLAEYGVYVQPINFPTVPRGTERLRFTPGPAHTEEMMHELTDALVEIWDRLDLELAQGRLTGQIRRTTRGSPDSYIGPPRRGPRCTKSN